MKRIVALLGTLIVATACGSAGPPPIVLGPERQRQALSPGEIEAIANLLFHEDHRRFDDAVFRPLSGDASIEVRRRTALAAGRIGDHAATPLLIHMVGRDPSAAVRADAAFALGLLGDTSALVLEALRAAAPRDWSTVRPEETTLTVEVIGALGRLGTDEARGLVIEALRRAYPARDANSRRIAAEGLLAVWRFPTGAGRALSATRFVDHPDPDLRWRAALALVRLGLPEGTSRLVGLLDDPDPRVRALAARGLAAPAADSAGVATAALQGLAGALDDSHPHVRINAVRALATFGDRADLQAIADRVRDEDANVAIAAVDALATLGSGAVAPLTALLANGASPLGPRAAALARLAALDPDAALPVVEEWAADEALRYAAARAVGALGWPRGRPLLERLAADPDPRVAVAATEAAAVLAGQDELDDATREEVRVLLRRLEDAADARRRAPALRALEAATPAVAATREDLDFYRDIVRRYVVPAMASGRRPEATIRTPHGDIRLDLLAEEAPLTVHNFLTLANDGYYDDGVWHRVVPNFVLQDGAPAGDPSGGPGWSIRDEINRVRYDRGILGMALAGPDTGGSQWFITHSPQPHLDGGYTVFGRVTAGERAMDRVVQGDPVITIRVRP
jgi:cyclophilin family peptidyl-prolyl cis-trans isomerase/HEAT repeat protein